MHSVAHKSVLQVATSARQLVQVAPSPVANCRQRLAQAVGSTAEVQSPSPHRPPQSCAQLKSHSLSLLHTPSPHTTAGVVSTSSVVSASSVVSTSVVSG